MKASATMLVVLLAGSSLLSILSWGMMAVSELVDRSIFFRDSGDVVRVNCGSELNFPVCCMPS